MYLYGCQTDYWRYFTQKRTILHMLTKMGVCVWIGGGAGGGVCRGRGGGGRRGERRCGGDNIRVV